MKREVRICNNCGAVMKARFGGKIKVLDKKTVYTCERCDNRRHAFEWILGFEMFKVSTSCEKSNQIRRDLEHGKISGILKDAFVTNGIEITNNENLTEKGPLWQISANNTSFTLDFEHFPAARKSNCSTERPYEGKAEVVVYSGGYKPFIWNTIRRYFYTNFHSVSNLRRKDMEKFHWRALTEYPRRKGKYVRPTLLLLTCEGLGGNKDDALLTAAAMQTSEDWILVHDDFQDGSLKRRGKATLHVYYGPELAVNAGDSLHIIMWKMLIDNFLKIESKRAIAVMTEFYEMLHRTTLGQTAEISWILSNASDLSYDDIYYIIDGKTGYYTIAGPMRLGAIIAGIDGEELDRIFMFGCALGRAYQVTDDLLDVTSDFRGLKKKGNDIYEGKRTIMLMHLIRNASVYDERRILEVLKKSRARKTKKDVELILNLMEEYGSIDFGREEAKKYGKESLSILEKMDFIGNNAREALKLGVDFMINRDF